jgi:dTDP-4-dehydrorhamnose reductase
MSEDNSDQPLVLIVGASGFLGANVLLSLQKTFRCVAHSSTSKIMSEQFDCIVSDLRHKNSATALVEMLKPSLVLNCAALADIDLCESNLELAVRLNSVMPGELAQGCAATGAKLVHVSTDAVFGSSVLPVEPLSIVSPINNYGRTKAAGEEFVLNYLPSAMVVRTNIIGWSPTGSRSLLEFFYNSLLRGEPVKGFADSYFRPISANNFWPLVSEWLPSATGGIFHAFGSQLISKYDFGCRVAKAFNFDPNLVSSTSLESESPLNVRSKSLNLTPSHVYEEALLDIDMSLKVLSKLALSGYRENLSQLLAMTQQGT